MLHFVQLEDYNFVVGVYWRAGHWTLIVSVFILYYIYNNYRPYVQPNSWSETLCQHHLHDMWELKSEVW